MGPLSEEVIYYESIMFGSYYGVWILKVLWIYIFIQGEVNLGPLSEEGNVTTKYRNCGVVVSWQPGRHLECLG